MTSAGVRPPFAGVGVADPPVGKPIRTDSIIRKFLLWWFRQPHGIAHVSLSISIDMTHALAYLDRLAELDGPKVSVQHLLSGVIGRTLHHHPAANARIVGRRIVPVDSVAAAMPVMTTKMVYQTSWMFARGFLTRISWIAMVMG